MTSKYEVLQKGPLQKLAVPHDQLPPHLYLVLHPGHQHSFERKYRPGIDWDETIKNGIKPQFYNMLGGIRAACPSPLSCACTTTNIAIIYEQMRQYFDGNSRHLSCFIPTFSSYDAALNWGQSFEWGYVNIFHIDTSPLTLPGMRACHIFRPSDLDIRWPKDQFLFFHQIPQSAITGITDIPLELMRRKCYLPLPYHLSSPNGRFD